MSINVKEKEDEAGGIFSPGGDGSKQGNQAAWNRHVTK